MQFKIHNKRVQLWVYDGYDADRKRSKMRMIGSFRRYIGPDAKLLEKLTPEQRQELEEWIAEKDRASALTNARYAVQHITLYMDEASDVLERIVSGDPSLEGVKVEIDPDAAHAALDRLRKALNRAGHKRTAKGKKQPKTPENQSKLDL